MGFLDFNRESIIQATGINLPTGVWEIIDAIIICLALGYIFQGVFTPVARRVANYDPLDEFRGKLKNKRSDFWLSVITVAPAVILHELGHKLVAMSFGLKSVFYASYSFLGLGLLMKLMGAPFVFFVPAYVTHPVAAPLVSSLIAVSGPLVNLALWGISLYLIKSREKFNFSERTLIILNYMKTINLFLFFFNMIPIPPFDGFNFFRGLLVGLF